MTIPLTAQFRSLATPSGKKAFEAYCAVSLDETREAMIAAPTLEALKHAWREFTDTDLIVERAQHVWIVKAEDAKDAPVSSARGVEVPCSIANCTQLASFIIKRKAYCAEHRKAAG